MKPQFECDEALRSEFAEIFRGAYDIAKLQFEEPPVVLDIGANVGAFSKWATLRWPGCKVVAYEPHPKTAAVFLRNCPGIELHEKAVIGGGQPVGNGMLVRPGVSKVRLYDGAGNSGQTSLTDIGQQDMNSTHDVAVTWAGDLRPCDFMKIDTEGSELPILRDYGHLNRVRGISLEFHRPEDQWHIGKLLTDAGFICSLSKMWPQPTGGWMKWRRP